MKLKDLALDAIDAGRTLSNVAAEKLTTGIVFNPTRSDVVANPYPFYAALREKRPVHRSRGTGGWVLSRYADVETVLTDKRFTSDERVGSSFERQKRRMLRKDLSTPADFENPDLLGLDGDRHARVRGLVAKTFTPKSIRGWTGRVERVVEDCLDAIEGKSETDLIADLASPVPVMIIAEILGVPTEDRVRFKQWSDTIAAGVGFDSTPALMRQQRNASRALRGYLEGVAEARRREPRDDLISALLAAEEAGDRLSMEEFYRTVSLLLIAGNETTTNLIGNGMLALLRNPDQLDRLRADPSLIDNAIEELLRYDSPVQMTRRLVTEDLDFEGARFRRGQMVVVLLGSANRDPGHFENPDWLDIGRSIDRHMSFSLGRHFCLGAQLARLEARTALSALIERQPGMKLATDSVTFRKNPVLRGLKQLPLRL